MGIGAVECAGIKHERFANQMLLGDVAVAITDKIIRFGGYGSLKQFGIVAMKRCGRCSSTAIPRKTRLNASASVMEQSATGSVSFVDSWTPLSSPPFCDAGPWSTASRCRRL